MKCDESLIIQADCKKTGANCHAINEGICNYRIAARIESDESISKRSRLVAKYTFESWEAFLRCFVSTGIVKDMRGNKRYI